MEFPLEIWNMAPMPSYGEAIATQLKEEGFPVDLQTVEFGTWIDDMFAGPQKAMMASGFCTDGGLNGVFGRDAATATAMGYDMPEVHDLLDQANVTLDASERDQILREAQDLMFSQYMAIPLRHRSGYDATRSYVHDLNGIFWTANIVTDQNNVWLDK
jgi:ABC-type transport system substrate-binding protein